jgi:hypothetical protein
VACQEIYVTGVLHDIGKIGIPDQVLLKAGKLDADELRIIQQHPEIGHKILEEFDKLKFALPGVLYHHERIDGGGYPHRLRGDSIPLMARILAVSDAYDAMTSSRVYRNAMGQERAVEILRNGIGTQWDEKAARPQLFKERTLRFDYRNERVNDIDDLLAKLFKGYRDLFDTGVGCRPKRCRQLFPSWVQPDTNCILLLENGMRKAIAK